MTLRRISGLISSPLRLSTLLYACTASRTDASSLIAADPPGLSWLPAVPLRKATLPRNSHRSAFVESTAKPSCSRAMASPSPPAWARLNATFMRTLASPGLKFRYSR